jgi:hypothetical protein
MSKDVDVYRELAEQLYTLSTPAFRVELTQILRQLARQRLEEQYRAVGREAPPQYFHLDEVPATMKQSDEASG